MISGIVLATGLALGATPPPAPPPEPPAEIAGLVAQLRLPVPADTRYAETRFVHVLRKPLQLRGELHYGGAGVLGKRVDTPYRETTTIANGQVEVQRDGKSAKRFSLERAPELEALLDSFSALLGGDAAALERHFSIELIRSKDEELERKSNVAVLRGSKNWRLTLTPRSRDLARHLGQLIVDGHDGAVRCVSLHEADGDASVMRMGALADAALPDPPTVSALDALCRGAAL